MIYLFEAQREEEYGFSQEPLLQLRLSLLTSKFSVAQVLRRGEEEKGVKTRYFLFMATYFTMSVGGFFDCQIPMCTLYVCMTFEAFKSEVWIFYESLAKLKDTK